jgi:hypothetical protein
VAVELDVVDPAATAAAVDHLDEVVETKEYAECTNSEAETVEIVAVEAHIAEEAAAMEAAGKLEEHNWDGNFEQIMEQELELDEAAVAADDVAAAADDAAADRATVVDHSHFEDPAREVAGQCTEQDSAAHTRHLLEQGHYSRLHADCMEMTLENHLCHLGYGSHLYLFHVRRLEVTDGHHKEAVGIVEDNQLVGQPDEEEEEVGVGSCTGLQPSHPFATCRVSRQRYA